MVQTKTERRFSKLAAAMNQKARRLGAAGTVTATDLGLVYLAADRKCEYCGVEVTPQGVSFDHAIAFAKGGQNIRENLVSACMTCQRSKFTKTPEEWDRARALTVQCTVCGKEFKPRWADYVRGFGRTCSRVCSGRKGGEAIPA